MTAYGYDLERDEWKVCDELGDVGWIYTDADGLVVDHQSFEEDADWMLDKKFNWVANICRKKGWWIEDVKDAE